MNIRQFAAMLRRTLDEGHSVENELNQFSLKPDVLPSINLTDPQDGDTLQYDASTGKLVNVTGGDTIDLSGPP